MGNRLVSITSDDMCDDVKRGNPKCNQHVMATVLCYMTGSCLLSMRIIQTFCIAIRQIFQGSALTHYHHEVAKICVIPLHS